MTGSSKMGSDWLLSQLPSLYTIVQITVSSVKLFISLSDVDFWCFMESDYPSVI